MPVELLMVRRGDVLVPAWPQDEEEMLRVPNRKAMQVTITRTVPDKLRAWYRALCGRLYDACPGAWPNPNMVHRSMLLKAGYFEVVKVTDFGDVTFKPPSTKDWDEIQWREYLDVLWPLIVTEIIPEIGEKRLRDSIRAMIGLTLEQALESTT